MRGGEQFPLLQLFLRIFWVGSVSFIYEIFFLLSHEFSCFCSFSAVQFFRSVL